jgi:hypothetical protein
MNTKTFKILATVVLACGLLTAAGPTSQSSDNHQVPVDVVRLINTAEQAQRQQFGKYVTWSDLANSPIFKKVQNEVAPRYHLKGVSLSPGSEVIPHHELRLVPSASGDQYQLSLADKNDCGFALFSDERGLIYVGSVMGCTK